MVAAAAPNSAAMAAPATSPSSARATCGSRAAATMPAPAAERAGSGRVGEVAMRARASAKWASGRSGARSTATEDRSTASSTARARRARSASRTSATACHGRLRIPSSRMASRSDRAAWRAPAASCSRMAARRARHSSSIRAGEMRTGSIGRWNRRISSAEMVTPGTAPGGGDGAASLGPGAATGGGSGSGGWAGSGTASPALALRVFGSSGGSSPSTSEGAWTWAPVRAGRRRNTATTANARALTGDSDASTGCSALETGAMSRTSLAVERLVAIMARLRGPDGCPWDREQTLESLRPYVLEETYEVLEAIDEGDPEAHREELGDLLLQIVFQARLAEEEGRFDLAGVADAISEKLLSRHPHVFGPDARSADDRPGPEATDVRDAEAVLRQWASLKKKENEAKGRGKSVLEGVPRELPALARAERLTEKASRIGFDWPDASGARAKVAEEICRAGRGDRVGGSGPHRGRAGGRPLRRGQPFPETGDSARGGAARNARPLHRPLPLRGGGLAASRQAPRHRDARRDGPSLGRGEGGFRPNSKDFLTPRRSPRPSWKVRGQVEIDSVAFYPPDPRINLLSRSRYHIDLNDSGRLSMFRFGWTRKGAPERVLAILKNPQGG